MNAAVAFVRNEPRFQPITGPSNIPAQGVLVMSGDFPAGVRINSMYATARADRGGLLHEARYYVGAALAGSVLFGLALGWAGHRELVQGVGALVGLLMYPSVRRHFRD